MRRNTYKCDGPGVERAVAQLRETLEREKRFPPSAADLEWQKHLPELPDDDETVVLILPNHERE